MIELTHPHLNSYNTNISQLLEMLLWCIRRWSHDWWSQSCAACGFRWPSSPRQAPRRGPVRLGFSWTKLCKSLTAPLGAWVTTTLLQQPHDDKTGRYHCGGRGHDGWGILKMTYFNDNIWRQALILPLLYQPSNRCCQRCLADAVTTKAGHICERERTSVAVAHAKLVFMRSYCTTVARALTGVSRSLHAIHTHRVCLSFSLSTSC